MRHHQEQGILFHTTTARPFWVGDVDITRRVPAPPRRIAAAATTTSLGTRLARLMAALGGR